MDNTENIDDMDDGIDPRYHPEIPKKVIMTNLEMKTLDDVDSTCLINIGEDSEDSEKEIEIKGINDIFDFSLSAAHRLAALNQTDIDSAIEAVNKIRSMYTLSSISVIQSFLFDVAVKSNLPIDIKMQCADSLCEESNLFGDKMDYKKQLGLDCLMALCQEMDRVEMLTTHGCRLSSNIHADRILYLINNNVTGSDNLFYSFICRSDIDSKFRYRTILAVDGDLMINACRIFANDCNTNVRYKILGCQNLLGSNVSDHEKTGLLQLLLAIANDKTEHVNTRADAADTVIRHGITSDERELGKKIINKMGWDSGTVGTIYTNSQNVHAVAIEESAMDVIKVLISKELPPKQFNSIRKKLVQRAKEKYRPSFFGAGRKIFAVQISDNETLISNSLDRIEVDRTLFTNYLTLKSILSMIYVFIGDNDVMIDRLLEELIDMSDTCTSGYVFRLVNSLSGFADFSIQISWKDQIFANLNGRLNARIRDLTEEKCSLVLEGLTSNDMTTRRPFLEFFRENISSIREEMHAEFKDYISDTDFDLYCTKAVINYEK